MLLFSTLASTTLAFELLNRDMDVNIFKEDVSLPLMVTASESAVSGDVFHIQGEVNVTKIIPVMGRQIKALILAQNDGCKFRVSSSEPEVEVSDAAIHIRVTSGAEIWLCTGFSKTKVVQETGTIVAAITPGIRNGALVLNLSSFEVHDLSKISGMLGIEKQLKNRFKGLLNSFNEDQKLSQLPDVLVENGFVYSSATLENTYRDRQTLSLEIQGPNDALTLLKGSSCTDHQIERGSVPSLMSLVETHQAT